MPVLKTLSGDFNYKSSNLEWPLTTETGPGMEGVIACSSQVGWIDAKDTGLNYRGIPVSEIAGKLTFEEVAFLLIEGKNSDSHIEDFKSFSDRLHSARRLPVQVVEIVRNLPRDTHPTRLLRAGVSALGCYEISAEDDLYGAKHWEDLRIVGQVAELVAIVSRHINNLPLHTTNLSHSLSEGLLCAIKDRTPTEKEINLLNLVWTLYADHGLDAPTFTSMIVGSALADPYYNIVAGLSALRGPLLGSAGERVLKQLLELRDKHVARAWVCSMIQQKWHIPGFGHRIYSKPDPRVNILKQAIAENMNSQEIENLFNVALAVEKEVENHLSEKGVYANVNFYAAILFYMLGACPEMVPCLYAVGRIAGVVARVREYLTHNRLFRPNEEYSGQELGKKYIPLEDR